MSDLVQLNVADVPMVKLVAALARGGFSIKSDATGQLHVKAVKPEPVEYDPPPLRDRKCRACGARMVKVMMPPRMAFSESSGAVQLREAVICLYCQDDDSVSVRASKVQA